MIYTLQLEEKSITWSKQGLRRQMQKQWEKSIVGQ